MQQVCDSGGAVKFGVPWPKSEKPLQSFSIAFDGRPSEKIALNGGVELANIASATMLAMQSSTDEGGDAERALDGNTDNNEGNPGLGASCSRTGRQASPWWRADLGTAEFVHTVRVHNHAGTYGAEMSNLEIFVNDVGPMALTASNEFLATSTSSQCGQATMS